MKIIENYRKAYQAANGRNPTIVKRGAWVRVNGVAYRLADLVDFTERLKLRIPASDPHKQARRKIRRAHQLSVERVQDNNY